jgi:hypothetical protein
VKGDGMAGVPSQWEGTGQEDGESGKAGAYQSGARLGGRLTVGQTWYSPGGVRGPVTGPRPEVSPRTGHTDERISRCGSA